MINIDLTTKNTVYNSLGAQAQWVQHRFGCRNYPDLELDTDTVKQLISQANDTVNLISVFGDPSEHADIIEIIDFIEPGKLIFNSYLNFDNDKLIDLLNSKQAYIVFPCYGINELADKIILNSNWQQIQHNLARLTCTVCVEFYLFEHNIQQIPLIKTLCNTHSLKLELKQGTAVHPDGFSSVVNEHAEWLYDVYSCSADQKVIKWPELCQTVNGYNSLIQFVKPIDGVSILERKNFYKIRNSFTSDNISVSVTGHVFPSYELHQIFSNALCTDWNFSFSKITEFNKITVKPEYIHLCSSLTNICDMLDFNCLSKHNYSDILVNFADSNA
jgi:hypothetical protein